MRFALADPPYYGHAVQFYADHPEAAVYDTLEGHAALIARLVAEYRDGWALCMTSQNLKDILPLCPRECRVGAWTKPFASFKPGVPIAFCWEPLVWFGGRKRTRGTEGTIRDYCRVPITLRRGLTGAKPEGFCHWVFDLLGAGEGDTMDDLFPGSGAVGRAWESWLRFQAGLFQGVT